MSQLARTGSGIARTGSPLGRTERQRRERSGPSAGEGEVVRPVGCSSSCRSTNTVKPLNTANLGSHI